MSMNQIKISTVTTITSKTPRQDAQDGWYELLSPTQVLIEQPNMNIGTNPQQQHQKKKKKSHGNRKEQHRRRNMRRQQQRQQQQMMNDSNHMDQDIMIIEEEEDEDNNNSQYDQVQTYSLQHHQETKSENKRKRQELNSADIDVTRSFSQLSVSQETKKKKKKTTKIIKETLSKNQEKKNIESDQSINANDIQRLKPQYLRVSER